MNLKNILRSGDYVTLVPFGAKITLQYNDKGNLEKVFKGFNTTDEFDFDTIQSINNQNSTFPSHIVSRTISGTCWVSGVLYTASDILSSFESVNDAILDMYLKSPNKFNFFACTCKSTAFKFNGTANLNTWLKSNSFNTLEGFLTGGDYHPGMLDHFIETRFKFKYPLLASYLIYNGESFQFIETQIASHIVSTVKTEVTENGYVLGRLICKDGFEMKCSYSEVVEFNIQRNTCILLNENGSICYSYSIDNKNREKRPDTITCSFCGRPIKVVKGEAVICGDRSCTSRLYSSVSHFCNVLKLPVITYEEYLEHVKDKSITCLSDILLIDEYKDLEIKSTLGSILDAIVPVDCVRNRSVFTLFANNCSNNVQTFLYYVENPNKIEQDFKTSEFKSLISWLRNSENLQDVVTILNSKNFKFELCDKKYDGDPIFRGNVIYLTGKFLHGPVSEIIKILQSYSAEVVTKFDDSVNVVLVGDIPEDVSGVSIRKAKRRHIPIYQESGFFKMYEIDNDLKENL